MPWVYYIKCFMGVSEVPAAVKEGGTLSQGMPGFLQHESTMN
jgi:hypothetical protein